MADRIDITPVPHAATDWVIPNGWGGHQDLPATRIDRGIATAWVPSRKAVKALRGNAAITLCVTVQEDGTPCISMAVTPVNLTDKGKGPTRG